MIVAGPAEALHERPGPVMDGAFVRCGAGQSAAGEGEEDVGAVVVGGDDDAAGPVDARLPEGLADGGAAVDCHVGVAGEARLPVDEDEGDRLADEGAGDGGDAETGGAGR